MTPRQRARYWRDWRAVRAILVDQGEYSPEDADAERHEIHRRALGADKSSKQLTNRDLDKILAAFGTYLALAGPLTRPDPVSQPCRRLIWAIEQLGLEEPYLQAICQAQHGHDRWRELPEPDLARFRYTATARATARRHSGDA